MDATKRALLVGMGGFVGANARYWIGAALVAGAPWTTLGINVAGSFLLGALIGTSPSTSWRLLLGVGVLGGFTTFSAFALETVELVEARALARAGLYVAGSVFLSLLAAGAGLALIRGWAAR